MELVVTVVIEVDEVEDDDCELEELDDAELEEDDELLIWLELDELVVVVVVPPWARRK